MDVINLQILASFSLEYDISDCKTNIVKMKVQYCMSLLSDLFTILQSVRSEQTISTQRRKLAFVKKQKNIFSYNNKEYITILLQNLTPLAVTIRLMFQITSLLLNEETFVFLIDNFNNIRCFDFGCHSNEI